jgi:hypothetical protein
MASITTTDAAAQECDFSTPGACTKTSIAALRACRADAREEVWLAIANCRNESEDAKECAVEAREETPELKEECIEVCSARQDVCDGVGQAPYDPEIDPANFMNPADIAANPNPYFPLVPGTVWTYEDEAGDETITVTVTDETIEILGVPCMVVRDVAEEDGEVIEDTLDWYAQDLDGNVWYFGEISQEFEDGVLLGVEGSWKSGVKSAKPGIVMFADPQIGTVYRQEFFLDDAEDIAEVLSLTGDESSPVADCNGACLVTLETTPLDSEANENKYYVAGVGLVVEVDNNTGDRVELVGMVTP